MTLYNKKCISQNVIYKNNIRENNSFRSVYDQVMKSYNENTHLAEEN
jgi:hypothetical protein